MERRSLRGPARLLILAALLVTPWAATASPLSQQLDTGTPSTLSRIAPGEAQVTATRPQTPLLFVPNTGQFDPRARFQLRGGGGVWWFTDDAVWLTVLEKPSPPHPLSPQYRASARFGRGGEGGEGQPRHGVHLRLTFPGMSPAARLVSADPQPSKMDYFLGNDASRWHSNVPTYGTLRWEGVHPGLNLTFGRAGAGLGLTVEADSDAALAPLRLRIEGADAVRVDDTGGLIADTAIGPIPLPPLLTDDSKSLRPVVAGDDITFAPSPLNPLAESVDSPADDPTDLLYSTFLGGSGRDTAMGIALGRDGAIYVTGTTASTDFPITPGAFDPSYNGGIDIFVTKFDPSGSALEYSTFLGGSTNDCPYDWSRCSIVVGVDGSAYVAGTTRSGDFPITPGAFDTSFSGGGVCDCDAFVTKLDPSGSALVYSTYLGGSYDDEANDIAIDGNGAAYVTGLTESANFPTTPGAFDTILNSQDAFVSKLNASGSELVYSTFLGGAAYDQGFDVEMNRGGEAHIVGQTQSLDFPTTPGAFDTSFNGNWDGFVTKLNADGTGLVYSTYLGGSASDCETPGNYDECKMAMGASGGVYVAGMTESSNFPVTPGAFDTTYNGGRDVFVAALNTDGSHVLYGTYLGGSGLECAFRCAVALGTDGSVYVAGDTQSDNFPTTPGAFDTGYNGGSDAFMSKLSPDGSALVYSTFLGEGGEDNGYGIALDDAGAAFVAGLTNSVGFPTTPGAFDTSHNGLTDAFISRLSPDLVPMHVASIDPLYRPVGDRYLLIARVTIQDSNSSPVADAAVTVAITPPSGPEVNVTRTTDSSGVATFRRYVRLTGTYTFCVSQVIKYGWLYDPAQNVETCESITIP